MIVLFFTEALRCSIVLTHLGRIMCEQKKLLLSHEPINWSYRQSRSYQPEIPAEQASFIAVATSSLSFKDTTLRWERQAEEKLYLLVSSLIEKMLDCNDCILWIGQL